MPEASAWGGSVLLLSGLYTIHRSYTQGNYRNTPFWERVGRDALERSHDSGAAVGVTLTEAQCKYYCKECPEEGATCTHEGITLGTLPLEKNWWRATEVSTLLYSCTLDKACVGSRPPLSSLAMSRCATTATKVRRSPSRKPRLEKECAGASFEQLVACHAFWREFRGWR